MPIDRIGWQVVAIRPSGADTWFLRPRAERLTPERLTTGAVTCHPEWMQLGQHAVLTLPSAAEPRGGSA